MNKRSIVYSIIKIVGIAGMIGVIVVAPNATIAFEQIVGKKKKVKSKKAYGDYLRRSGYFEVEKVGNDRFVVRLSPKGGKAYSGLDFKKCLIKPTKWDKKWHLLMYDIPDKNRKTRLFISNNLLKAGLKPLQNSVYVYPYDLLKLADGIRQEYPEIASLILSVSVDRIDGEYQLIKAFNLY